MQGVKKKLINLRCYNHTVLYQNETHIVPGSPVLYMCMLDLLLQSNCMYWSTMSSHNPSSHLCLIAFGTSLSGMIYAGLSEERKGTKIFRMVFKILASHAGVWLVSRLSPHQPPASHRQTFHSNCNVRANQISVIVL